MLPPLDTIIKNIRDSADEYAAEGRQSFSNDIDMLRMYNKDQAALHKVADLLAKGDYSGAADTAYYLDTVPREVIPDDAWKFLKRLF